MSIRVHPIQVNRVPNACCPVVVTLRAYEVYSYVYGKQEALISGGCRGGFSAGELIAFLYAYGFPKEEWSQRCQEAFNGMVTSL